MFWVDYSNDNINRVTGIEMAAPSSSIRNLVTTGIGCAGKFLTVNHYIATRCC